MNCLECQDLLQARLDGRAVADRAALDRHLGDCADCRERHSAAQRLAEGLRRLAPPAPSAGLSARIVSNVLAERRAGLRFRRRVWAAAVAAGLLLGVFTGYQAFRRGLFGTGGEGSPLAEQPRPAAPTKKAPAPSLRAAFREAGSVAYALTRRTADETLARALRWLPARPLSPGRPLKGGDPLAPVLDPPARSLRQAGRTVSAGLKPVTTSWGRAVNLFWQKIPAGNRKQSSDS
jgi:hypothetical protein